MTIIQGYVLDTDLDSLVSGQGSIGMELLGDDQEDPALLQEPCLSGHEGISQPGEVPLVLLLHGGQRVGGGYQGHDGG